jgi:sodium/proline symporter
VTALSAAASDMSGWLLLGLPGYAYAAGLEAGWIALGLLLGTYCNWRIIAKRLRIYSEQVGDALTLPSFFAKRFEDGHYLLQSVSAVFILLFFLFYTSSGLVAGGKLFETVFGISYPWAVLSGAMTIIVYTLFGGFLAVSRTDVVQGLLMLAALLVVPLVVVIKNGGWRETLIAVENTNPALLNPFTDEKGERLGFIAIFSLMGWGLGYFGQPHILARFKAIKRVSEMRSARRIAVSWTALTLLGAILVGILGIAYQQPRLIGEETEKIFILVVGGIFHPLLAGILLAAILAAIMSTVDSQLLVSSSTLTEDFYKTLLHREANQKELVFVGRVAVAIIAVLAYLLALDPNNKVLDLVAYAWAGFGAAFGPALILSLYWKRMNKNGALAGIIAGGVTVVVWKQLQGGIYDLYEIVPGFIVSLLAIVLVSVFGTKPSDSITERHKKVEILDKNTM